MLVRVAVSYDDGTKPELAFTLSMDLGAIGRAAPEEVWAAATRMLSPHAVLAIQSLRDG